MIYSKIVQKYFSTEKKAFWFGGEVKKNIST